MTNINDFKNLTNVIDTPYYVIAVPLLADRLLSFLTDTPASKKLITPRFSATNPVKFYDFAEAVTALDYLKKNI